MAASVLELKGVSKSFGSHLAVNDISLSLKPGEIYGFLGPNGAGKTTTIRMAMNFIRPSAGVVELFGQTLDTGSAEIYSQVGFLSADSTLYANWSAQKHINFVESIRGRAGQKDRLVKDLGIDLSTPYHRLSSGNKQKLALALSMIHQPKLLILDEPTRGLDPLLQQEIYNLLAEFRKGGGSVFMSSHNLNEVQKICDHVGIIRSGKLVASETLESLRKKNVHQITVQFSQPADLGKLELEIPKLKNIELIRSHNHSLTVNVRGDLNAFMNKVLEHKIADLEVTHISLEELFMRYYQ